MARLIKIMSDVPNIIDEIYDQYRYYFLNENKSN